MTSELIDEFINATITNILKCDNDFNHEEILAQCQAADETFERGEQLTQIQKTKIMLVDMMRELVTKISEDIKVEILTEVHLELEDIRANQSQVPEKKSQSMFDLVMGM